MLIKIRFLLINRIHFNAFGGAKYARKLGGGLIIGCIVLFTGRRAYNWSKRWWGLSVGRGISGGLWYEKQLLGEVFVISGIIKVEVSTRLITLTETLIILQKPNLSIVLLYIVLK